MVIIFIIFILFKMTTIKTIEEEEQGDWCYGTTNCNSTTYIMCGGSAKWWNYVIEWDKDGIQNTIWIQDSSGKHMVKDQGTIWVDEDGHRLMLSYEEPKIGEWTEIVHYE
jgi:hypothetical protein